MKTISVVTGKTKRNLYFIVILLFAVISIFFIINAQYQYRNTKKILISDAVQKSSVQVNQCINIISKSLDKAIYLVETNTNYSDALLTNDTSFIRSALNPIITNLVEPQNAFFAIYAQNGNQLFNSLGVPFHTSTKYNIDRKPDSVYSYFKIGRASCRERV